MTLSEAYDVCHELVRSSCNKEKGCKGRYKCVNASLNVAVIASVWNKNSLTIVTFYDFRNQHQFMNNRKSVARCESCLNLITKKP